jgi:hypothetical protein
MELSELPVGVAEVVNFDREVFEIESGKKSIGEDLCVAFDDLQKCVFLSIDKHVGNQIFDDIKIAQWIYEDDFKVKRQDAREYNLANLYAAKKTFLRMNEELLGNKAKPAANDIFRYRHLISTFIHDLGAFIDILEQEIEPDFTFASGFKSYHTRSFESYMLAKSFYKDSLFYDEPIPALYGRKGSRFDFKGTQGASVMYIRQSIEIRTKRILGIYTIYPVRGHKPYDFKKLFDFFDANTTDIEYNQMNFDIMRKIYWWACRYVHNGEVSYLWQTESAFHYLSPFFAIGEHDGIRSVFGAFKIRNYESIIEKLQAFLGSGLKFRHNKSFVEAILIE